MKIVTALAFVAALAGPVIASDLVVHKEKHTDPVSTGGQTRPAEDTVQVLWIGKDRLRFEEGEKVTIVRADLKKMYLLDMEARTCSTVDLPLDLKKYMPADAAPMMEKMLSRSRPTVTPTGETKKIKDWNATRYTVTMTMPTMETHSATPTGAEASSRVAGGGTTQEIWVTEDIGADHAGWQEMYASLLSANPFQAALADEMKELGGFPVLVETTRKMGPAEIKSHEAVTSVEVQEAAAGFYDVPAGFTEKPFEPLARIGLPGGRPRGQ